MSDAPVPRWVWGALLLAYPVAVLIFDGLGRVVAVVLLAIAALALGTVEIVREVGR